jgi:polyisoprenoid-binding protein YceI
MSKPLKLALSALLVLVVAGGAFVWWFFQDDAPAEVDLEAAVESVEDNTDDDQPNTTTGEAEAAEAADGGVSGTWSVDTESGTFDFEDTATGTFVGFRVEEELSTIGSATAVGRTPEVAGEVTIDGTTLTAATFQADLTAITTNESRRDSRVQSALETGQFPVATFTLTEPVDLGEAAANGDPVAVTALGELTIHGITQTVEIPLEAQLVNGTIVVIGSMDIEFADYDVEVPAAPVVLSAEDHGVLEVQLLLTQS